METTTKEEQNSLRLRNSTPGPSSSKRYSRGNPSKRLSGCEDRELFHEMVEKIWNYAEAVENSKRGIRDGSVSPEPAHIPAETDRPASGEEKTLPRCVICFPRPGIFARLLPVASGWHDFLDKENRRYRCKAGGQRVESEDLRGRPCRK